MQISVVIPVYNAGRYVRAAVRSALQQSETGEVILVEDGSTDDSLNGCRELAASDSRVRLLQHPGGRNHGAGASRNLGIVHARFDFIAFLDADDYYLPDRFASAREIFRHNAGIDGVYDAVKAGFEDETAQQQWLRMHGQGFDDHLYTVRKIVPPENLFEMFMSHAHGLFHTDGIVVRKRLFSRTNLFDEKLRLCQDMAMWIKMSAVGLLAPGNLSVPVAVWRIHAANRSMKNTPERRHSLDRMYHSVFKWSLKTDIADSRKNSLLHNYLNHYERYRFESRFWRVRKLCGLLHLPVVVLSCPGTLHFPACKAYARDCMRALLGRPVLND